jgi:hypothetical protein
MLFGAEAAEVPVQTDRVSRFQLAGVGRLDHFGGEQVEGAEDVLFAVLVEEAPGAAWKSMRSVVGQRRRISGKVWRTIFGSGHEWEVVELRKVDFGRHGEGCLVGTVLTCNTLFQ